MVRWILACLVTAWAFPDRAAVVAEGEKAPEGSIVISYDPPPKPPPDLDRSGLCRDAPRAPARDVRTDKTIAELLGPEAQSIKVLYYDKKHWDKFEEVKSVLNALLAAKPRTIFSYEPWAQSVRPSIVATIEYKDKKKGALQVGGSGTYLCFQDHTGAYWWTLLPAPSVPPKTEGAPKEAKTTADILKQFESIKRWVATLEFSYDNEKRFIIWYNPYSGRAACHVHGYVFDAKKERWVLQLDRVFEGTHRVSVEVGAVLTIRDAKGEVVYKEKTEN
jgi:hypothetical protein